MSLESMLSDFRKGPGAEQWNGQTERDIVGFVAEPGKERIVTIADSSVFRPVILEVNQHNLALERAKCLKAFLVLGGICIALFAAGLSQAVVLPALFAAQYGTAYLHARSGLGRLRSDPDGYLAELSAQLRLGYWQGMGGNRGMARTWTMAGAWALLSIMQLTASLMKGGGRPDLSAAALVKPLILAEPWRLLTGPMLHGSLMHLLMNVSGMLALGPIIELSVHRKLVALVWMAGALAGSLLSWAASPATSVGASGGLMSLFGFLLVMSWRRKALLPPGFLNSLLRDLLATALFGILAWAIIDNAAHAGGLLAGVSIALLVFRQSKGGLPLGETTGVQWLGSISEASFVGVALFAGYRLLASI